MSATFFPSIVHSRYMYGMAIQNHNAKDNGKMCYQKGSQEIPSWFTDKNVRITYSHSFLHTAICTIEKRSEEKVQWRLKKAHRIVGTKSKIDEIAE